MGLQHFFIVLLGVPGQAEIVDGRPGFQQKRIEDRRLARAIRADEYHELRTTARADSITQYIRAEIQVREHIRRRNRRIGEQRQLRDVLGCAIPLTASAVVAATWGYRP